MSFQKIATMSVDTVDLTENYVGDNYVKQWESQLRVLSSEIVNSGNRKIPGLLLKVQSK